MTYSDPLRDPKKAFGKLLENEYKAELYLVDRYQAFVAELLRLSLLGIAVFGFLYKSMFSGLKALSLASHITIMIDLSKTLAALGVLIFGICAASALVFRYFATEGARFYIEALRLTSGETCRAELSLDKRHRKIVICRVSKLLATSCLFIGSLLIAIAFYLLVMYAL